MKKILTGVLALVLALGFTIFTQPSAVAADSPDTVTVHLTVSLQDENGKNVFAKALDGSDMAAKAVQVSDQDDDGILTAYDILVCAHKQFAPGGMNDFAVVTGNRQTVQAKKVWGSEGEFYFLDGQAVNYYKNFAKNLKFNTYRVNEFAHLSVVQSKKIDFFSNATIVNSAQGSLQNSKTACITAIANQKFTVGLYTADFTTTSLKNQVVKPTGREVYYTEVGSNTETCAGTINAAGKLICTFPKKGTYLLYTKDAGDNAPAACLVHVLNEKAEINQLRLSLSEDSGNLLTDFSPKDTAYTITIPEDTKYLYGAAECNGAAFNMRWRFDSTSNGQKWTASTVSYPFGIENIGSLNIRSASQIRIYAHDYQLLKTNDAPLSEYYTFNIKRQVQLSDLTTSGAVRSDADFRTGSLDVYVAYDAETAALMPTAADGVTITVAGQEVTSGAEHTVTLTGADTVVKITVHRDGDNFVDGEYTVTFHRAADQVAPVFRENPTLELQEYVQGEHETYLKPLTVLADANGTVSYQWYYNTTDSTENGKKIDGETNRSYTPSVAANAIGDRYYYCVASNGESSTPSTTVHVIVYEYPIVSLEWDMDIPDLPEEKADLFDGHTKGFYYHQGDTDVTPLRMKLTIPDSLLSKQQDGSLSITYWWTSNGKTVHTTEPTYTPATDIVYGGRTWDGCNVIIRFLNRQYVATLTEPIYVYVDRAGSSYPDTVKLTGDGTKTSPWELATQTDLETLRGYVSEGYDFADTYFCMVDDISLDTSWESIGEGVDGDRGVDWKIFSGTFDGGGHTLTYAEDTDQPLFKYVREATVQNLTIKAPHLKNYGLVSNYAVDYGADGDYSLGTGGSYQAGTPDTIDIINVTIKEGSRIDKAGFIGGFASGANIINIRDCVVEKGVTIGTIEEPNVGSFGGLFNGTISNCVSYANVYGNGAVGGIVGQKGQSMGLYDITNCAFLGTVTANGKYAGGIAGSGYYASSAPNTPGALIQNCYVNGTITGVDCVGGIFGGEPSQIQAWDLSEIQNNAFYGTVIATGENASYGGIIGSMASLNQNNIIENNYYIEGCGADTGIGNVLYLDTSYENPAHPEGCTVFDSSTGNLPEPWGISQLDKNRTDDPLGTDADKLAAMKTADKFKDGTVVALLNASDSSWKNWTQGTNGPVQSREPIFYKLEVSGSYKETYKPGEELDLTGIKFTAYRSDNIVMHPALSEVKQLSTFDPQFIGEQELIFQYGVAKATIYVSVVKEYTDDDREDFGTATVLFTLSNDDQFVTSDSVTLSNVPITVTYFDLANYGLERYYCYDDTGNPVEQPTMLHLFIAAMEQYVLGVDEENCGRGLLKQSPNYAKLLSTTGSAGSMYMTQFWNHDQNLTYFYNGDYPLESKGRGATADQILLKDGDFVDVAMYTDWSFWSEKMSGFHFFSADGKTPQKTFTVEKNANLKLTYLRARANMNGDPAEYFVTPDTTVYYAKSMSSGTTYTAVTDETDGTVTLTFPETGTWYVWTYGAKGGSKNSVISAPGCATVTVTPSQAELDQAKADEVKKLIEAIGEVTENSGSAIDAARKAYDALTPAQQELVDNYEDLVNAENAYQAILDKKAAERVEALIDDIGVVTKDSGDAIKAARDAYDALTPAQRKLVGNYKTLLAAEKRYEDLTKPVTPVEPSKPAKPSTKPTDEPAKPDASKFVDVSKNNWYFDAVQYVLENGLMNGTSANEFSPNANTTRGMIVTILARLDGVDTSGSSPWYAAGRTWAMNNGISDGTNMEGKITREQLAAMLYRYAKLKGYDVAASADISGYADASSVSIWATDAMRWAVGAGLINGRTATTLAPQGNATRAEVAAILMRFAQKIAK